jgi:hypothetical protein
LAQAEFDRFVTALRAEGVNVLVVEDVAPPSRPDAIFPNNWISTHTGGIQVLYPMEARNRRIERRDDIIAAIESQAGFRAQRRIDLTQHEAEGRFLEGTGSLVLDHMQRRAYACRSTRTDAGLVREWAQLLGYEPMVFSANDAAGRPYYHTNVMLSIGTRFAIVAAETIADGERAAVLEALGASGRRVITISAAAAAEFAANVLELATWDEALGDSSLLVMSQRARAAFTAQQLQVLSAAVDTVLAVPIPTIEQVGGGGTRCMLAEIFTD